MNLPEESKVFTLLQVCNSIQKAVRERYQRTYWIKAEMNKLNHYVHSGHCYPDLVQKENGKVIAQMRSTLWSGAFQRINRKFLDVLQEPLKDGIKILFLARIDFDPVHGLNLNIEDIDPSFTLGDLEKEKQETIERLKKEGLFDLNKRLPIPMLPQRIAIISVESSKGYLDFTRIIDDNAWKYKFFHFLFPSLLQGDKAVDAIIAQLNRIRKVLSHFDVVAIIRGGGGEVGLTCYNDYRLAAEIATFPLPVLTGIGHSTNQTVVEMISAIHAITPTDMADILLQKFHNFSVPVERAKTTLKSAPLQHLEDWKQNFEFQKRFFDSVASRRIDLHHHALKRSSQHLAQYSQFSIQKSNSAVLQQKQTLSRIYRNLLDENGLRLKQFKQELPKSCKRFIGNLDIHLIHFEKQLNLLSPEAVLRRGYSITRVNGKAVNAVEEIQIGQIIETQLADGRLTAEVKNTSKEKI